MADVASALASLLASGGWHLEAGPDGAWSVNDALHVAFRAAESGDGAPALVFRIQNGPPIGTVLHVARHFLPEGAPVRLDVDRSFTGTGVLAVLRIEGCAHDRSRANCVLREADLRLWMKRLAEEQFRMGALAEAADRERSKRPTDRPFVNRLDSHTVPTPPGWLAYKNSYKHVRTGAVLLLQRGTMTDGTTWTFAGVTSPGDLAEAVLVAAKAFVGEGKKVVLGVAHGSTDAASVGYCHDREHADSVPVEREAIAARFASDPRLRSLTRRDDGDRWAPGSPIPLAYSEQWIQVLSMSTASFSYRHAPAAVSVTERADPTADERSIVVGSLDETWSLERIMEAATSFIKRGTRVRVEVDVQPTAVTFHHGVHHELVEGMPLEEDAIEQALAPHWQRLRSTKASDEAALARARMKRERKGRRGSHPGN